MPGIRASPASRLVALVRVVRLDTKSRKSLGESESSGNSHGKGRLTEDIKNLRVLLEKTARKPGDYLPGRREGDHLQIIGVMNFKGGSGKTTSSAHLAQRLALTGYRVLEIDLDPQASLTALHGVRPEFDLLDGGTLYDAIRYEDPVPIAEVIRKTYTNGLRFRLFGDSQGLRCLIRCRLMMGRLGWQGSRSRGGN